MKLHLDQIKETPTDHRFEADAAWNAAAVEVMPELVGEGAQPLEVSLRAYRMGGDLLLEGELRCGAVLECARCLTRYCEPLRESFRLVLEPVRARVPPDPEAARALAETGMCLGEELELGWFQGRELDLTRFLLEVIALALPVQPVCKSECRGLCPQCGIDRNEASCDCGHRRESSPFAVLARLRKSES